MKVFFFKEDFRNVTEFYYNVILDALKNKSVERVMMDHCNIITALSISKGDYVLVTTLRSFIILYLCGVRHFIYWYQGVTPEEVGLMMNSKWRFYVYSFLERLSLKKVEYKIGVSKYLFEHFENKYKMSINKETCFIMPCFNSLLNEASFKTLHKYDNNVFCYAGGTQAWQGFDKILSLYSEIEKKYKNVFLKIYSKDIENAQKLIEKANIHNFSVNSVPQSEIDHALADCKFGFIIREDSIINNVATPTKLGTYLANGVIPIFSSSIFSFRDLSEKYNYLCCVKDDTDVIDKVKVLLEQKLIGVDIYNEYCHIFSDYYNRDNYVMELVTFFNF